MSSAITAKHAAAKMRQKFQPAGDDAVIPFTVAGLGARGRAVRLGPQLDVLIKRHAYPEPVAALLAQAAALTILLGSALKFNGKFIMQAQTDGAVNMLVCDYIPPAEPDKPAALRGFARFDKEKLAALSPAEQKDQARLLGAGTLAFTVDQGAHMQPYQGIVHLDNMNLEQAAHHYFAQSEQIPTKIRLAAAVLHSRAETEAALRHEQRGAGILIQYLPQNSADAQQEAAAPRAAADKWRETELLTATATDAELTDPQLSAEQLLYRLFHEHGARVFPPQKIADKCSCSRQKLFNILVSLPEKERQASLENGKITAKCRFCSAEYSFAPEEFSAQS